jgi:hypothetical protein
VRTKGPGESLLLLLDAAALLADEGIAYAAIGGLAASVHGPVRASEDADAVLSIDAGRLRQLEKKFLAAGFQTQLTQGDFDDPVPAVLVLLDRHGNKVDLLGGLRGLEPAAFSRARAVPFEGEALRVIGREDFIAMKVFAGSHKDMADALSALRVAGDAVDLVLVRRLAQRYGQSTLEALERMLSESR